ncbi:MAG: hypothetical protein EZS28_002041 [Streblomastix strix]|uniref:Protein kinase domain-containing protein n=1 Tax=Streblomastix strix TaxID=222440 RepID=A0A5J4X703_9EUKA|nr:MAG: hypothetical protein EZS28_002041 [Streblomastix strix]
MKQALEGVKVLHKAAIIHRPPGSGRVHVKISDFGLAKIQQFQNVQIYTQGTLPFMAPELFKWPIIVTQKVDIYALGITFYKLLLHELPVNQKNFQDQKLVLIDMPRIEKPSEITDNLLWDLLSKMLNFDPNKRISAVEALQHPYFTSPEAKADLLKNNYMLKIICLNKIYQISPKGWKKANKIVSKLSNLEQ